MEVRAYGMIMVTRSPTLTQNPTEIIDSLLHPLALEIGQLLDDREERPSHAMLIDDEENIMQALGAGITVQRVFHTSDTSLTEELRRGLAPATEVHEIAKRTCKKLFKTSKWSRVFAVARTPQPLVLADLACLNKDIVVLENLGIAGNIGAIIRTAAALGAGAIVLLDAEVEVHDRRLIRASRGHVFSLPVVKAATGDLVAFCQQHDWPLLVASPHASLPAHDVAGLGERLVIAFGNEKEGCSQALRDAANFQVKIPTEPVVESLNVSAAASIILFQRSPLTFPTAAR
jgi:tRNA G18 (ribose-2'-O)-methylase SpoU